MINDITNPEREELIALYSTYIQGGKQREGQALMNALGTVRLDLYDEIHGTETDCFYDDDLIPNFLRRFGF